MPLGRRVLLGVALVLGIALGAPRSADAFRPPEDGLFLLDAPLSLSASPGVVGTDPVSTPELALRAGYLRAIAPWFALGADLSLGVSSQGGGTPAVLYSELGLPTRLHALVSVPIRLQALELYPLLGAGLFVQPGFGILEAGGESRVGPRLGFGGSVATGLLLRIWAIGLRFDVAAGVRETGVEIVSRVGLGAAF